ncbi:FtsK/SpoIIIE domain-containing protein [Pseudonocardia acidicola]|uniref:FtsK domain-containing protein n=1 Tax=Pseudonocardia acidicola TaxID=2724939 RepID=A0ABX1SDC3_9PSEU|nr:hypothetical protein [Pseudonocardia acidicola]
MCRQVDTPSGVTVSTPPLVSVVLGPPTVLVARLLPGQLVGDLRRASYRLAGHLGAVALRIEPRGLTYARIELLAADPLDAVLPLDLTPARGGVLLGRDEAGCEVRVEPVELPHLVVQGQTRSGKSAFLYALIAQLASDDDVTVAGVDPSGLTLRPFAGTRHGEHQTCGLADLDRIEKVLAGLVAEMDHRLTVMPADRDIMATGPGVPLIVVVLDEYPATLRALDAADTKQGKRVRALVARLLAESHKVGFRVVIAAQRAEAAIVGAAERAQAAGRLSFRVDSPDTVKLLHSDADDLAGAHTTAPPGIALLTWPGRPLSRIRAPWIGSYAAFVSAVERGA